MSTPRPNVVMIVCHDLGRSLSCYGEIPQGLTPNLDKMASLGARMSQNFSAAPYCSPARGALITGQYPTTNGLMGLVNLGWSLPERTRTLDKAMKQLGYHTALMGLQHEMPNEADLEFDYVGTRKVGHAGERVARETAKYIEDVIQQPKPFYIRAGFSEAHRAFLPAVDDPASVMVPPFMADTRGAREDLAQFYASIRAIDKAVGLIMDQLAESNVLDDTLVVFTTDHGIAFPRAKGTLYDSGTGTAMLWRYPRTIQPGQVHDTMVSHVDVMPTILEAVGSHAASTVQGRSYWSLLTGKAYRPRGVVFTMKNTSAGDLKRAVRTETYKYILNLDPGPKLLLPGDIESGLTRRDMGNAHVEPRPRVELYDLTNDPHEKTNLAGRSEVRVVEAELDRQLKLHRQQAADPTLTGPLQRPVDEFRRISEAVDRYENRCPFSREGLVNSWRVQQDYLKA